SCSSLETAAFSLILAVLLVALWIDDSPWALRVAAAACMLAFLERIDGFIHAGILVSAAIIAVPADRRRQILRQVVLPAATVLVTYHLWRRWYFGQWMSMPFLAKVQYKLKLSGVIVDKPAEEGYLVQFLRAVWWTPIGVFVVPVLLWTRDRGAR